jgi:tRNA(fMet)-specific endonuclease VapC
MLDTNTVSYIIRGKSPASRTKLANLPHGESACISLITEAELHYGLAESSNAPALQAAVQGFLARIQVLVWGKEAAQAYGSLRVKQEKAGKPLGSLDMLIAAHAISVSAVLVTNDKAFLSVNDLAATTENWATDL